jgi:hypothetical protein
MTDSILWRRLDLPGHEPKWQGLQSPIRQHPTGLTRLPTRNHVREVMRSSAHWSALLGGGALIQAHHADGD